MQSNDLLWLRKLAALVFIKLVVLAVLWWVFVREYRMAANSETTAVRMLDAKQSGTVDRSASEVGRHALNNDSQGTTR